MTARELIDAIGQHGASLGLSADGWLVLSGSGVPLPEQLLQAIGRQRADVVAALIVAVRRQELHLMLQQPDMIRVIRYAPEVFEHPPCDGWISYIGPEYFELTAFCSGVSTAP